MASSTPAAEPRRAPVATSAASERTAGTSRAALACVAVALAALLIFSPALRNDFAELDDNAYVTRNEHVRQGITLDNLRWVATAYVGGNWHPLTVISHMLDCQVYGLAPWGHHLTSLLLHAANTGLCGWLWWRMTGRLWSSLLVAALFGWHPLRVESVAWVAERKDVLSTSFGLLAILAYVGWTERRDGWRYALLLAFAAASLMSKPMLVTLPCVLLLLDYWPLGRLADDSKPSAAAIKPARLRQAVWEKLPLFGLSLLLCVVTYFAQLEHGVRSLDKLPLVWRVLNAAVAYIDYLGQTVWPAKLAVFYPHRANRLPVDYAALCGLLVALASWFAWKQRAARPYLAVGWLWYLGTLMPVIGMVQVGGAARADRYTYVPLIGVFVALAWSLADWAAASRPRLLGATVACLVWLAVLAVVTVQQIGVWRDPATLFAHAAAVTERNFFAPYVLGTLQLDDRDHAAALERFDESLEIKPDYGQALVGKGYCLHQLARIGESAEAYRRAEQAGALGPVERLDYAYVLVRDRQFSEAEQQFMAILAADSQLLDPSLGLAICDARRGRPQEAIRRFRQVVAAQPHHALATDRLVRLLVAQSSQAASSNSGARRSPEALTLAQAAAKHAPDDAALAHTLAIAQAAAGEFSRAIEQAEAARRLASEQLASLGHPKASDTASLAEATRERELRALREEIDDHLALFRRRQAYLEDPADCRLPPGF